MRISHDAHDTSPRVQHFSGFQQLYLEEVFKSSFCWMNNAMNGGGLYMYIMHTLYIAPLQVLHPYFFIYLYIYNNNI